MIIRDEAAGDIYSDDACQNRGPHFNTPEPYKGHYDY
ncbi:HNH/endonuclease VII fold putative polymorphic toxin [Acetobacter fabarum]